MAARGQGYVSFDGVKGLEEGKTSDDLDGDGEREILELLERPRVMHSDVRSPSQERPISSGTGAVRGGANTHLRMRKGSVVDGGGSVDDSYDYEVGYGHRNKNGNANGNSNVVVSPVETPISAGGAGVFGGTGRRVFSFSSPGAM